MENFSEFEIAIIEKELTKKSFRDIAFLIDRSADEIKFFVTEYLQGKEILPYQYVLDQKKKHRSPVARKPRESKEKKKEPVITSRIIIPEQKQKRNRAGEIVYKTKVVDYSQLQEVKIDPKTWIYIKPGEDPVSAKEKYLKRLAECKSRSSEEAKARGDNYRREKLKTIVKL